MSDPTGSKGLDGWRAELGEASVIVNGSYFAKSGSPATPLITNGVLLGPNDYDAKHGVFAAGEIGGGIVDLAGRSWKETLRGVKNGFVSYPLLVDEKGGTRASGNPRWLANRSFLAEDRDGALLIGTTAGCFFSLPRLAEFLLKSPLRLRIALNLDGGPVACQGVQHPKFNRNFCGSYETRTRNGEVEMLEPRIAGRRWGLPIVLAAYRQRSLPQ